MIKGMLNLPSPSNLSFMWGFGSSLSLCYGFQVITGLLLASMYTSGNFYLSLRAMNLGWLVHSCHVNLANTIFILLFSHSGRGIYYKLYMSTMVWMSGVTILILTMGTAFLGYVLPWGQMSFWGATVITSLMTAIPYIGESIVMWLWGGFSLTEISLSRFYMLHYSIPFIIMFIMLIHLLMLHIKGSSNPLGISSHYDMIFFHPSYTYKDILGLLMLTSSIMTVCIHNPYMLLDPENFMEANPMNTPIHIQPEWYFLFAYCILRSIPNKLMGVIALAMSLIIWFIIPITNKNKMIFNPFKKMMFWMFLSIMILLTFIGGNPVEPPYVTMGQSGAIMYFTIIWSL